MLRRPAELRGSVTRSSAPPSRFRRMTTPPIVLVPGFWLGAWAWDEVAAALRADGHDVTALTLPGLESTDADRSSITLADHVDAICEAVTARGPPVVLAVHSGAGAPATRSPTVSRSRSPRWSTSTPARRRRARPRLRRRREAAALAGGARARRISTAQRGALETFRGAPSPSRVRRYATPTSSQRRPPRRPEHRLCTAYTRAVQGRRRGGLRRSSPAWPSCAT